MSRKHKSRKPLLIILSMWGLMVIMGATYAALHVIGWAMLTALISTVTYFAGRGKRESITHHNVKTALNAMYGPAGPVIVTDINLAYPVMPDEHTALRGDIADALKSLGWPASMIKPQMINNAISAVKVSGQDVSIQTVLPVILRAAGEAKARRINP